MSDNIKFVEKVKAYRELITAIGVAIAAIGAVASTFISAQPQDAKLPQEQIDKINTASASSIAAEKIAKEALIRANNNNLRLDLRGEEFIPCVVRQLDALNFKTKTLPVCKLESPREAMPTSEKYKG